MATFLIPITVLILCGISSLMFFQDCAEHLSVEDTERTDSWASKKSMLVYTCIMITVTLCIAVVTVLNEPDPNIFTGLKQMMLLCVIWPLAYIDYKTYRIPNAFILYGLGCRAVLIPFELMFNPYFRVDIISELIAAGALLLAAVLCVVCMHGAIGAGDIKLFVVMGLLLGMNVMWSAIFLSLLISFAFAAYLLITKKKSRKDVIPFGPAIVLGVYLSICLMRG